MKRILLVVFLCLSFPAALLLATVAPATAQPDGEARQSVVLNPQPGWNIATTSLNYSKSPAILGAGSRLFRWTCGPSFAAPPGPEKIWYTTSTDNGRTWQGGNAVLQPSASGQLDSAGVCDPSVVKFGAYYYLAYTGTSSAGKHGVFVARSSALEGPFAKWTGTGWGNNGIVMPVIFTTPSGYGTGGPSLVLADNKLLVYYGYHDGARWQTRLSTVDVSSGVDTWPTRLQDQGTVLEHPGFDPSPCSGSWMTNSTDVKFVNSLGKFVAVTSDSENYRLSSIQTWESTDGLHFTRAITMRGDFQSHTMNVSLVGDDRGHISTAFPKAIAYNYGQSTCIPDALRFSPIELYAATTGGYADTLLADRGTWVVGAGDWSFRSTQPNGGYGQNSYATGNFSTLANFRVGDSWTFDVDIAQAFPPFSDYAGVNFGQLKVDDSYESGYRALWWQDGLVELRKDGRVVASTQLLFPHQEGHLQVVQSGPNIKIYVGQRGGEAHLSNPAVEYIDQDAPYLGGYVSLSAGGKAWFTNLRITDNVPANYKAADWRASAGSWSMPAPNRMVQSNPAVGGQNFLSTGPTTATGVFNAHLGDGTYSATIKLDAGTDQQGWAGLNIANTSTAATLSLWEGGYLVFLRRNGNLGLYKAGSGQIGDDYPTGTQPAVTPVKIRVVKRGPSLQVYVNENQLPSLNFRDNTSAIPKIGGFGLATLATAGTFTDVRYAASDGR